MKRAILFLALAVVANLNSAIQTTDGCHTDTECEIAAARHCDRGETVYCEVSR